MFDYCNGIAKYWYDIIMNNLYFPDSLHQYNALSIFLWA